MDLLSHACYLLNTWYHLFQNSFVSNEGFEDDEIEDKLDEIYYTFACEHKQYQPIFSSNYNKYPLADINVSVSNLTDVIDCLTKID